MIMRQLINKQGDTDFYDLNNTKKNHNHHINLRPIDLHPNKKTAVPNGTALLFIG